MNILIPMAGLGSRFKDAGYDKPKPLIDVNGKTMIERVLENFNNHPTKKNKFTIIYNLNQIDTNELADSIFKVVNFFERVPLTEQTQGPADSCLQAEHTINTNEELIIINCDQIILDFNWTYFETFLKINKPDAVIGTFFSNHPRNSYICLNQNNEVAVTKEKQVISNIATNGFHYWSKASLFFDSVKKMMLNDDCFNNEFYVGPSFNYLPTNTKILPYHFNCHFPIGIPEHLTNFLNIFNENPKT